MLRSIRISFLASLVALAFAACGGGSSNPPLPDGGGQEDGPRVQFDGPRNEGGTPQQDAGGDGGGTGACVASGGVATAGVCKNSKPCTCPNDCVVQIADSAAGSCWPKPDPSTGCANSTDVALYYDTEDNSHCYPTATLTGTFSVPIGTVQTMGGTSTVTVTINGESFTTTQGFATHDTGTSTWMIGLEPAVATALPLNVIEIFIPDSAYNTTTPIDWATVTAADLTLVKFTTDNAMVMYGRGYAGTLTLTTADTGTTGTVAGTFGGTFTIFGAVGEFCGPNTEPC